jgi:hypothetical protein
MKHPGPFERITETKTAKIGTQKSVLPPRQRAVPQNRLSPAAMAKLHKLGFELIPHPPYSPDLTPCDFFLFPNFKI